LLTGNDDLRRQVYSPQKSDAKENDPNRSFKHETSSTTVVLNCRLSKKRDLGVDVQQP
jgi:hypothetical protein